MKIGNIKIEGLARLAPMAGISNAPFRSIAKECGSGLTTSEEMLLRSIQTNTRLQFLSLFQMDLETTIKKDLILILSICWLTKHNYLA